MMAHWWSCVLGLLCMPAEVILSTWTVSQDPLSISLRRINSSAEITCSSSSLDLVGFKLRKRFHTDDEVMYVSLENGQVDKSTIAAGFAGRIDIAPDLQVRQGCRFTLQLSLLRQEDTDLYYCSWIGFQSKKQTPETLSSNGTILIITEADPQECEYNYLEFILIALTVTAFTVLFICIGTLIVRHKRFKKRFRPARAVGPPRPNRHVCPQQTPQHCPYLITSANTLDFRGIL